MKIIKCRECKIKMITISESKYVRKYECPECGSIRIIEGDWKLPKAQMKLREATE